MIMQNIENQKIIHHFHKKYYSFCLLQRRNLAFESIADYLLLSCLKRLPCTYRRNNCIPPILFFLTVFFTSIVPRCLVFFTIPSTYLIKTNDIITIYENKTVISYSLLHRIFIHQCTKYKSTG